MATYTTGTTLTFAGASYSVTSITYSMTDVGGDDTIDISDLSLAEGDPVATMARPLTGSGSDTGREVSIEYIGNAPITDGAVGGRSLHAEFCHARRQRCDPRLRDVPGRSRLVATGRLPRGRVLDRHLRGVQRHCVFAGRWPVVELRRRNASRARLRVDARGRRRRDRDARWRAGCLRCIRHAVDHRRRHGLDLHGSMHGVRSDRRNQRRHSLFSLVFNPDIESPT